MKNIVKVLLVSFLICSLHSSAQSWLWGNEPIPKSTGVSGDIYFDHSVAADNNGNAFETGYFISSMAFGTVTLSSSSIDVFLAKYDSTGNVLWARQAVTPSTVSYGYGHSVATDTKGDAYIAGFFQDTMSFGGISLQAPGGLSDAFLVKYDANGNVLWAKQSSSPTGFGYAYSVAADTSGDAYITGIFWGTLSFGAVTLTSNATYGMVFIAKYDANGNVLWAKQATPPTTGSYSWGNSIAVDVAGNAYITGQFLNTVYFGANTLASPTNYDVFLVKYDANGNVLWATQGVPSGSSTYANVYSVTVDGPGNAYVAGQFSNTITFGSVTLQCHRTFYGDTSDVYLVKYDKNGNTIWADQGNILDGNAWRAYSVTSDTLPQGGGYMAIRANSIGSIPYQLSLGADTFSLNTANKSASLLVQFDSAGNILCGNIYTCSTQGIGYSGDSVKLKANGSAVGVDHIGKRIYMVGDIDTATIFGADTLTDKNMPFIARWKGGCCTVVPHIVGNVNVCKGDSIKLTAIGGSMYVWNSGSTNSSITVSPASATTYSVIVGNGVCTKNASTTITVTPFPVPVVSPTQTICPGDAIALNASGGANYVWVPSTGLNCNTCSNPMASPVSTTEYTVTLANGSCKVKDSINVVVMPLVAGSACCNSTIELGNDTMLSVAGASAGSMYSWTPSEGLSCVNCPNPIASPTVNTTYYVTITDSEGCNRTDTITIEVNQNCVFVPNAFSPNGDNQNDHECVYGDCIKTMDFSIFDRFGNKVFESTDPKQCWDGKYNGVLMNTAVFVYELKAILTNGKTISRKGNITLVR